MVCLCAAFTACGEPPQKNGPLISARLQEGDAGLRPCVDGGCPEGELCARYGLSPAEALLCVQSARICTVLDCVAPAECFIFTSSPPIVTCGTVSASP